MCFTDASRFIARGIVVLLALVIVSCGCSGGGGGGGGSDGVLPGVVSLPELKLPEMNEGNGRMILDSYILSYNKKTCEVSVTKARTAQQHYNITTLAFGENCDGCVNVTAVHLKAKHAVSVILSIENSYDDDGAHYDAFDVRGIFVQIGTDGDDEFVFDELDLISPLCNYTDLYADDEGMPDDPDEDAGSYGGTNPFYPYYTCTPTYGHADRALPYGDDEIQTFILAINEVEETGSSGWDDDIEALIMIDACQFNPPVSEPDEPYPNCPEPYLIEMDDKEDNFPEVIAGGGEQGQYDFSFTLWDHQHEYGDDSYIGDFDGFLTFFQYGEDITGDVSYWKAGDNGGGVYYYTITPDSTMYAGLYEGVIKMAEDGVTPTLKHKIWATVKGIPAVSTIDFTGLLPSAPVLYDWDDADGLDTFFTVGKTVFATGTAWGDEGKIIYPSSSYGGFHGVPTIKGDHIILACGYGGIVSNDCNVVVLDCNAGVDEEILWDTLLISVAAGQPVPVDIDGDADYEVFMLCKGGYKDAADHAYALNILDDDGDLIATGPVEDSPVYYGAAAILEDNGTTYAFMVRHGDYDILTLEAWELDDLDEESEPVSSYPLYYTTNPFAQTRPLAPVISKSGSDWIIYTPTYDKLFIHTWDGGDFTLVEDIDYPGDTYNYRSQLTLGDINGDGMEDVVVALQGAVCAYTGYRSAQGDCLQLIWSFIPESFYEFPTPVLIDCNGDHYLDVITAAQVTDGAITYDIVALDGSPYNNHNRIDTDDRFIWGYALATFVPYPVCPVLSEKVSGAYNYLEIGIPFSDGYYRAINTKFKYHDEDYQPDPWLKAYFSLNNWNNTQESPPY